MRYFSNVIKRAVRFIGGFPTTYVVIHRWCLRKEAYELRKFDTQRGPTTYQWVRCLNQRAVGKLHHDEEEAKWNFGEWGVWHCIGVDVITGQPLEQSEDSGKIRPVNLPVGGPVEGEQA